MRKIMFLLLIGIMVLAMVPGATAQDDSFTLTIMHTNDTHASHDPDGRSGNGGVARQAAVVKLIREQVANSLLLDGGDRFTGSLFHAQYRGQDQVQIMGLLGYDAMVLGNHEFDHGDQVAADFVSAVDFPVVTANIDFGASVLNGLVEPYAVLDVNGEQVGIIGLLTDDTTHKSNPSDDLVFSNDYAAITQQYVDELTARGVNKIILLTHMGVGLDSIVAAEVTGVDIIVGGDSHTRLSNLYTGAADSYPVVVENPDGQPVYIVQADDRNEFLGRLDVTFDGAGVVTRATGDLIQLYQYITADADMVALLDELRAPLTDLLEQVVGESGIFLDNEGAICRFEECAIGNLITDAIRAETNVDIAIMNGGGIRASIDEGEITMGEVLTVLPFGNLVSTLELKGEDVWAMFENSVSRWNSELGGTGRFLQVSGARYTWDYSQEVGSRLVSVDVLNADSGEYEPLDLEAVYSVAANNFMRGGGDQYTMLRDNAIDPYDYGRPLDAVVVDYIKANSPVAPELEERIVGLNAER